MILTSLILVIRAILTFTRPYSDILLDFIYRIIFGPQQTLPPIRDKILLMSATHVANYIRKRKLTAEEVVNAYVSRIKEVNPFLNAVVDERFAMALADARAVDQMLKEGNKSEEELKQSMPLLGVPFSCKEYIGVKGLTQANGLLYFRDRKAPSDAEVVMQYKKAGAIPVVVTNVPTLSMWWETSNLIFGRTLNPYDKRRTVGGSSGGEAALLTSGGSVIGIGTDLGGSIRVPSCFCGIYGHKPSRGVISIQKPWPLTNSKHDPFENTGPMCRYAQDLPLLVKVLSGSESRHLRLEEKVDFHNVTIYYMEELPGWLLSATSDIRKAVKRAADYFELNFGNTPTKLKLEEIKLAFEIWHCKFLEADGPPLRKFLSQTNPKINWYWEILKCLLRCSDYDLPTTFFAAIEKDDKDDHYHQCLEAYESLKRKLDEVLSGEAILLLPTHPEPAPHIMTTIPKVGNVAYTCIFNILGYPVTQIPAGQSRGIPIGIEAVAAHGQDRLTLAAAAELEKLFGGWKSPCPVDVFGQL